jgi:hypothetical protein
MSTADTTTEPCADTPPGSAEGLPGYAPIPRPVLGSALSEQGYYVGRVERHLYWVTDGTNPPDNIIIHLPDHDTLMLVDTVNPGWAPVYIANLTEDTSGYIEPSNALAYSWKHLIGGHLGGLGTRDDVALHERYIADISESSRKAIDTVDPTRYFVKYGENVVGQR